MALTTAQRDALCTELRQRRNLIARQLRERLHEGGQDVPAGLAAHLADGVDPSEAYEEMADDLAWLGHETSGLRQVDGALHRIATGRYGTCVHCGAAIPAERLLAVPTADSCVACQESTERVPHRHPG